MWRSLTTAFCCGALAWGVCVAGEPVTPGRDGFPAGSASPEGAACDLARAFIHDDPTLFLATCIEPFGSQESKKTRHQFLQSIVVQMKLDPAGKPPAPDSPQGIVKCFAARHLTQGGPASYGSAAFGFQDVMFVDVSALLQNGETRLCRTLVVQTSAGKWVVDPQPEISPLLCVGLDDEAPSTREIPGLGAAR